jgi:glycosyltransferase involved in cell wall biosynthesis
VGLSILIPVYNYNVTSLVQALAGQLIKTGKTGEIILLDDGSDSPLVSFNQSLQNIPSVSFYQNDNNQGRMAARQKLSSLASYNHLLFLDCDCEIIKYDFLAVYFDCMEKEAQLVSGGRVYFNTAPVICDLKLHWKYGTKRESTAKAFMSNNFFIKRELFIQLSNCPQLTGYGHEDSWWGIQFEQLGIKCQYINNPVLHTALETADVFLTKSENALGNLLVIEKNINKDVLIRYVKIFTWYCRLNRTGLSGVFLFFEKPFHNYFRRNLLSCKPSLLFFDCYRLAVLLRMGKKKSII